tara:strand:+ start:662 stop:865 length:204 start_codon:yes stop_codon:yes gene_type:complete
MILIRRKNLTVFSNDEIDIYLYDINEDIETMINPKNLLKSTSRLNISIPMIDHKRTTKYHMLNFEVK